MLVFGPVPSRRLGRSLGVNHIPPKHCPYACVYCQVGRTTHMGLDRQHFYDPDEIIDAVRRQIESLSLGDGIDYVTFVPDGEPTLDLGLGQAIRGVHALGCRVAVISNASLIWRQDAREDLLAADWVSLKFDAVREEIWRRIDRPHGRLSLDAIIEGAQCFSRAFDGQLVTETMLVRGLNDSTDIVSETAAHVASLQPDTAYLSVPTRPPCEPWVQPPDEAVLHRAFRLFSATVGRVEYLISYEGNTFQPTNDAERDLLAITAVHPMRRDAVDAYLQRAAADWSLIQRLLSAGALQELSYGSHTFYVRRFGRPAEGSAM